MSLHEPTTALRVASGFELRAWIHRSGHARKCLLLHGNPGSLEDWRALLEPLCAVADVAAVDLPGFGGTERAGSHARDVGLERMADVVAEIGDALGWDAPFFVIGHSHGGGIAQVFAAKYPRRTAGIVLLASLAFPAHLTYRLLTLPGVALVCRALGKFVQAPRLRWLAKWLVRTLMADVFFPERPSDAMVEQQLALFAAHPGILVSMSLVTHGDPCSQLAASVSEIRCPVLILHGQRDRLVPVKHAKNLQRRLIDGNVSPKFQVVPDAGHMLMLFQSVVVAQAISEFLAARRAPESDR